MKWSLIFLAILAGHAQAQIYRCDTAAGVEFSDQPCGESATIVVVDDSTSGIEIGPPEAVREQLAERKAQRAEEREERREAAARAPRQAPPPQQVIVETPRFYPGYWWRPNRPNRPHRPPVHRPLPQPVPPPNDGSMVLKPRP